MASERLAGYIMLAIVAGRCASKAPLEEHSNSAEDFFRNTVYKSHLGTLSDYEPMCVSHSRTWFHVVRRPTKSLRGRVHEPVAPGNASRPGAYCHKSCRQLPDSSVDWISKCTTYI